MAFQQSTITFSQAQTRVAQSGSAEANSGLLTRAGYAVQFAFEHWNNKQAWPFLAATATASVVAATASYALPTNFKQIYDVRLSNRTIQYLPQRQYDRAVWNQTAGADPTHYNLFLGGLDTGLITLIPTPGSADTMTLRYFRRMTIPDTAGTAIDIPQDYENYILALAKAFFLIDIGAPSERVSFWQGMAQEGMKIAMGSEARIPDGELLLIPGSSMTPFPAPADYLYPVE